MQVCMNTRHYRNTIIMENNIMPAFVYRLTQCPLCKQAHIKYICTGPNSLNINFHVWVLLN